MAETQTCKRSSLGSGSTRDYKQVGSSGPGYRIGQCVELAGLGSIKLFPNNPVPGHGGHDNGPGGDMQAERGIR